MFSQSVHRVAKALLVFQQRGDVVKIDAGLGEIGYFADEFFQRVSGHAADCSKPSSLLASSAWRTGFERKSFMPAARQALRSSAKALAVMARIGTAAPSPAPERRRRVASKPSIS